MKLTKIGTAFALVTASALALSACAANEQPAAPGGSSSASGLSGVLTGKGASSMNVAQTHWVAGFQKAHGGVTVNYSPDGSGPGRDAFKAGAANFAGSDRALKDSEMGVGKFAGCSTDSNALNLPVYISPIAVIFNIAGVSELNLDADTVARIFTGEIKNWNAPQIAALNPGVTLPDLPITAVHRSEGSGTTGNFTDYLAQNAPEVWTEASSDEWPASIAGEAAKGTSGVVDTVKKGNGMIGYADASQAREVGMAKIKVGNEFFGPTADAAAKLVDNAQRLEGRSEHDWALKLDRKAEGQYPIALISYVIVCETYADAQVAKLVKEYVGFIGSADGQALAAAPTAAGSAPLSADMVTKVQAAVASIK
ncbi:MAG: phosphate ABC transporter substrate-binding protein PstS [Propioniciclava sp.]|uniref:phosphate ABC transporter substrate-binding protein PstS n=1 Tax=Propioniciclava sp. TaxID=2038686 RepID=UPI0039E4D353